MPSTQSVNLIDQLDSYYSLAQGRLLFFADRWEPTHSNIRHLGSVEHDTEGYPIVEEAYQSLYRAIMEAMADEGTRCRLKDKLPGIRPQQLVRPLVPDFGFALTQLNAVYLDIRGDLEAIGPVAAGVPKPAMDPYSYAIGLKKKNPDWTDKKIAKAAGIHAGTLSKNRTWQAAKQVLEEPAGTPRRGRKTASGDIETDAD